MGLSLFFYSEKKNEGLLIGNVGSMFQLKSAELIGTITKGKKRGFNDWAECVSIHE